MTDAIQTPDPEARGATPYVWSNSWDQARQRLTLLNDLLDATTRRHMQALGLQPGWRCLDVATGAGSVARWLSEAVGERGRVVATDVDTRLLEQLRAPNLEVVEHNILEDPAPGRDFDLVHTRGLLLHLPQRERLLAEMVEWVAPGGWALIEEFDLYAIHAIGAPRYAQAWAIVSAGLARAGFAEAWARGLPALMDQAGLQDVGAVAETIVFHGGSAPAKWVELTWDQALTKLELAPDERATVLRARDELRERERWFVLPSLISTWGRRGPRTDG